MLKRHTAPVCPADRRCGVGSPGAIPIGDRVLVVDREQMNGRRRSAPGPHAADGPVRQAIDVNLAAADDGEAALTVCHREPGPPREVTQRRRAMTLEEAPA